ncbi:hypothetical protein P154DRAFT_175498 [Amniculicola lignicola CBS 123094]|uniref:Uncharacterized protein n=1 Tax=Amniculicola lignicola CBS 123094 TaxID=1392246 RepID=A0A6A5WIL0_9PLEO|nr:hypothetical protein P154DRAFT_175498 [Amniculicola lignicola CBS 123094]
MCAEVTDVENRKIPHAQGGLAHPCMDPRSLPTTTNTVVETGSSSYRAAVTCIMLNVPRCTTAGSVRIRIHPDIGGLLYVRAPTPTRPERSGAPRGRKGGIHLPMYLPTHP